MEDRSSVAFHRYAVLDTYRFLAASGVVFYHFENHFQPFLSLPTSYLDEFQHFVDFFFVLSGFVLMHTYGNRLQNWRDYKSFLRKRFARLYPLHFVTLVASCLIGAVVIALGMKVKDPSFFDFSLVPSNLLLIQAWGVNDHMGLNSPSWSLSAEMFVYLLFPILAVGLRRMGSLKTLVAVVLFTAAVEGVRTYFGMRPSNIATFDFGIFRALPAFVAGMATQVIVVSTPQRPIGWFAPNALGLLILVLMLLKAPSYLTISLFPVLVGLLALAERGGRPTILAAPFFVLLGNASFAIYITHPFFQIASVSFARKLGWTGPLGLSATAIIFYSAIVICGVLSYLYFETPLRRLLTGSRPFARSGSRRLAPTPVDAV